MDDLIDRLTALFHDRFPGSTPELHQFHSLDKVGGFLIWDGFDGIEQLDRQRQVRAAVRSYLSRDQVQNVTTILTATPDEAELMKAE